MVETIKTNWRPIIERILNETPVLKDFLSNIPPETCPSKENIFRCFNYFNIEQTKIVIIGQDPYHGNNQACGLAFAVEDDTPYPPSLKNIYKKLGYEVSLEEWAKKGVLLLNASLTAKKHTPGFYMKIWKPFTEKIIQELEKLSFITYIIWGNFALKLVKHTKHRMFVSSHPSPLSCMRNLGKYPSFFNSNALDNI